MNSQLTSTLAFHFATYNGGNKKEFDSSSDNNRQSSSKGNNPYKSNKPTYG